MTGSWAGAMGEVQFMPSTFLKYGVDQDRNGRIDIWGSVPDALGSVANYLRSLGWNGAEGWGREVALPAHFDAALASLDTDATETVKPLAQWSALGVRLPNGGPLPRQDIPAALILPAGIGGPAFLVYGDYRVILKYNHSTSYAIAIGYLADRLGGAGPLVAGRQPGEPLSRDTVLALQAGLATLGLLPGTPDGVLGAATRQAVRAFQKANGLPPDGYVDMRVIAAIRARSGAGSS
jgi:membrane-bound lytic murein transglycosylase B